MPNIFDKLNLKTETQLVVINAPESFEAALAELADREILRDAKKAKAITFALAFATTKAEVDQLTKALTAKITDDGTLWFAYPKQTSKKYKCEFNRDTGWQALGDAGYEPVRQVAIDEDWSALRFRKVAFIKSFKRAGAISVEGNKRVAKKTN
jgi:hypothetical protein